MLQALSFSVLLLMYVICVYVIICDDGDAVAYVVGLSSFVLFGLMLLVLLLLLLLLVVGMTLLLALVVDVVFLFMSIRVILQCV